MSRLPDMAVSPAIEAGAMELMSQSNWFVNNCKDQGCNAKWAWDNATSTIRNRWRHRFIAALAAFNNVKESTNEAV